MEFQSGGTTATPINSAGGTATAQNPEGPPAPAATGEAAIGDAAEAANFPDTYALWIDEGMGWKGTVNIIKAIPKLAAAYTANPQVDPGQLAQNVLGASAAQAAKINSLQQANSVAIAPETGFMTDVVGDVIETFYPISMVIFGLLLFIVWGIIALIAISKSPAGQSAVSRLSAAAGVAKL